MRFLSSYAALAAIALIAPPATSVTRAPAGTARVAATIVPNDNRRAAGTLANGTLAVALEATRGAWHPEGPGGMAIDVAAFAEVGKAPSTPGPLVRVTAGTRVRASIRNALDKPLIVYGFGDSVIVAPGATAPAQFTPTKPGTFYYYARRGGAGPVLRDPDDTQLQGAIVVDKPGAARDPNERIFVISWWFTLSEKSRTGLGRGTMAINGLSWPHTERVDLAQGDSAHWRLLNFTDIDHPMHLHGFYFRVDAHGDGNADTLYAATQQRMAVTEIVNPFSTAQIAWKAARPGNWVFHCHYATHLSTTIALDTKDGEFDGSQQAHHSAGDQPHQMFGLVLGLRVAPKGPAVAAGPIGRRLRIEQRERTIDGHNQMAFALDGAPGSEAGAFPVPGPPIILEKGQRVAVTTVNHSTQHATIHWHGIELESYPDGVPGWSGQSPNVLPSIAPHDSLTVQFTPPRAGAFMYHSHFNELEQMGSGLYGPLLVLEKGQRFDPATDKLFFLGTDGGGANVISGPFPSLLVNGTSAPGAMDLRVGTTYRFRFFNLAGDFPTQVELTTAGQMATWRAVAKDGYPLQAAQAIDKPAAFLYDPGEIYEFTFTPKTAGDMALTFKVPDFVTAPPPPPPPGAPPGPPPPVFPKSLVITLRAR